MDNIANQCSDLRVLLLLEFQMLLWWKELNLQGF